MRTKIKHLLHSKPSSTPFTVCGWIRTLRDQKSFGFIELNDGSCLSNLQIVAAPAHLTGLSTGASIRVTGRLTESPGQNQAVELHADTVELLGACPADRYPLQKKRHTFEYLRTLGHLRPRTNTQGAVARIRSALAHATHQFFQERGFLYVHTPIITGSDCEGGGEMFRVTTLNEVPLDKQNKPDYTKDFFHRPTYLTVSGQLEGEIYACALSDIYTFGPTFRAENSNTSRHLAEFWMIEPEMAFATLKENKELAEAYLKACLRHLLTHHQEDLQFFDQFIENGLLKRLENVVSLPFAHLTYTDAIDILKKAPRSFEYPVEWGTDLQSEHERYLAEEHCKRPVILTDYPAHIKAFYMRANDDGKTVAAMDVLVPKIGEIIGGSQREERLDRLEQKLIEHHLPRSDYWWYLELREFGSVPHAGFGLGFERLVLFATGMENIRDVIPFPRTPGHCEF
jgi:asparaginyl-tRNA synthetase